MNIESRTKAVFFDRDGIVIQPREDHHGPMHVSEMRIYPEIKPVILRAKELGYLTFIVSNQTHFAEGRIGSEEEELALEEKFLQLCRENNLVFDGIYYYNHSPKKAAIESRRVNCDCQKPRPGMVLKAAEKFNIDLSKSYVVGDRVSDIKLGQNVGAPTILYDPTEFQTEKIKELPKPPDYHVPSLLDIINILEKNNPSDYESAQNFFS